jgi:Peptidase family M3
MLRQLHFARVDLELHSRYDPAGGETIFECDRRLTKGTLPLPPLPEDRFLCSFAHIFAGAPPAAAGMPRMHVWESDRARACRGVLGRILQLQVGRGAVGGRVWRV